MNDKKLAVWNKIMERSTSTKLIDELEDHLDDTGICLSLFYLDDQLYLAFLEDLSGTNVSNDEIHIIDDGENLLKNGEAIDMLYDVLVEKCSHELVDKLEQEMRDKQCV